MEILYEVGTEVRVVQFDATVRELHARSAMVTEHAVERGVNITDHVRPERARLSVEAQVTNTPIKSPDVDGANGSIQKLELTETLRAFTKLASVSSTGSVDEAELETVEKAVNASVLQFPDSFDRVGSVHDILRQLQSDGTELTVVTSLETYESMVIADLSEPRDASSANALTFSMELVEIRFADSQVVDAPDPVEPRGRRGVDTGAQATRDVPATEQDGYNEFGARLLGVDGLTQVRSRPPTAKGTP